MMNIADLQNIPSGQNIQITLTNQDATDYLSNYLNKHQSELKELIRQRTKNDIDVSNPEIWFDEDIVNLSAKVGIKIIKLPAKASASVIWNGREAIVNVTSLDLPIIKADAEKANEIIKKPLQGFVKNIQKDFNILTFKIHKGKVSINAVKK